MMTGNVNIIFLVLSSIAIRTSNSYFYYPPPAPYPYYNNPYYLPCPQPIKPITPYYIPCNQPAPPCPYPNNSTNNSSCGKNVFLVLNPLTNSLDVQIIPSKACDNGTDNPPGTNPGNGTNPGGDNGGGGPGTCTLISLVIKLVQSILESLNNLLTSLLSSLLQLINSLLQSLLNGLLSNLTKLLNDTLTGVLGNLKNLLDTSGLGSGSDLLGTLLKTLQPLAGATPGPLSNVSDLLSQLLDSISQLLKSLLDPTAGQELIPELTLNISSLLNDTINDVDKLITDLFDDLLSNSSLSADLTKNLEVLITNVLNDSLCGIELILNDTGSLSALIGAIENSVVESLGSFLDDLGTTIDTLLSDLLNKLVDDLLKNLEKLVSDLFANLIGQKIDAIKSNPLMDPNNPMMENLTKCIQEAGDLPLPGVPPIPGIPSLPGAPPIPGIPSLPGVPLPGSPTGPIPFPDTANLSTPIPSLPGLDGPLKPLLTQLNNTLINLVESLRKVLTSLENQGGNSTSPITQGPISSLLKSVGDLVRGLIRTLLGDVKGLFDNQLGNITGAIGLQNITSPIGTLVTGLLKDLLGCNFTCGPIPPGGNNSNPPNGTLHPPGTYPPGSSPPCPFPCDPSCFTELLNQYQEAITSSFRASANKAIKSCAGRYQNDDYYDDDDGGTNILQNFPNQLLRGVDTAVDLTTSLTSCALPALLSSTVQNSNDRGSGAGIKLPIS